MEKREINGDSQVFVNDSKYNICKLRLYYLCNINNSEFFLFPFSVFHSTPSAPSAVNLFVSSILPSASNSPLSVLHHDLSIRRDPPALAGIDDQVPVQGRFVDAARLGIAPAQGEVDRPADLLVVE